MYEKPKFTKPRKGRGKLEDAKNYVKKKLTSAKNFLVKHKKAVAGVAGALGTLGAVGIAMNAYNKNKPVEPEYTVNPLLEFGSHRRGHEPALLDVRPKPRTLKHPIEEMEAKYPSRTLKHPIEEMEAKYPSRKGRGMDKSEVLREVQAYKKANGVSLKEAWKAVKAKEGSGMFDKAKKFVKKHQKTIGAVSGALTAGTLALLPHVLSNKKKSNSVRARYNKLPAPPLLDIPNYVPMSSHKDMRYSHSALPAPPNLGLSGGGIFQKAKEFVKKHKKVIAATAATAGTLGALALGARHVYNKNKQPKKRYVSLDMEEIPENTPYDGILRDWDKDYDPDVFGLGRKKLPNPNHPMGLYPEDDSSSSDDENHEKPLCRCGNGYHKIMSKLGGAYCASLVMKHKKYGNGFLDKLAHVSITKGFNFLGSLGMDLLIEIAVKYMGEENRKLAKRLIKKYGWRVVNLIKKYAHKGITFTMKMIKEELEKHGKGLCCECANTFEKNVMGNGLKNIKKMGCGFNDDFMDWFIKGSHTVGNFVNNLIPSALTSIATLPLRKVHHIANAVSSYKYRDPLGEEKEGGMKNLFQSLLNYMKQYPVKNLKQATFKGLIDNNIQITLSPPCSKTFKSKIAPHLSLSLSLASFFSSHTAMCVLSSCACLHTRMYLLSLYRVSSH
jgi:hypothetical protein